jgi:hypothetical protein
MVRFHQRTAVEDTDPSTQIIPREASTGTQQPILLPAGRYSTIAIPRADWRPPQSGLPCCPTPQLQVRTVVGEECVTLVFFTPGQAWPELGGTERELGLGMCVDCQLADLAPLSEAVGQPVHIAALGLLQQLNVLCLPTVVRLTPQAMPAHRESEP